MTDELARYRGQRGGSLWFWLRVMLETIGRRRLAPLVAARMRGERYAAVTGLEHVPPDGAFTLALNHYNGRAALDVAAAVLSAVAVRRPDVLDEIVFIVGQTSRAKSSWPRRVFDALRDGFYGRWARHLVKIPLKNRTPSAVGLRDWASRGQSVLVFPEGKASLTFGAVRAGAGRWLAGQPTPTVPVGVWWVVDEGWHVRFGSAIRWPVKRHLQDTQLALKLADVLPPDLAPAWRDDLARWRAALMKH